LGLYSVIRSALWTVNGYPGDRYKRLLAASQHWSRPQMLEFRDEKLRRLVKHCYESVPYYRRVMEARRLTPSDVRSAGDLTKMPILTKDAFRNHSPDLMARGISSRSIAWTRTGGTTGEPIRLAKTRECKAWEGMCYERGLEWGGMRVDDPRVRLFGGSLGLGRPRLSAQLGKLVRSELFIPAFELREDTARAYINEIQQSGFRFLLGYASAIYRLAALSEELGEPLRFAAVFPTAELLLPEWGEIIQRAFHCAVLPYYGCGEANSLAFSPAHGCAYRIAEEHALIEVANRGGEALCGDGRFLITDLDNYAMPILRYENGDAGKISEPGGDGSPFSRIERLDGRFNSFLMTDKGFLISGVIGTHVFKEVTSVKAYQIIQEEPRRIAIKIVETPAFTEADERLIVDLFARHLGPGMAIGVEKVPNIPISPSGKAVFVINRFLDKARA
jgi:phenylacetate-CoA ligase